MLQFGTDKVLISAQEVNLTKLTTTEKEFADFLAKAGAGFDVWITRG